MVSAYHVTREAGKNVVVLIVEVYDKIYDQLVAVYFTA
jgi:hypothetical protein